MAFRPPSQSHNEPAALFFAPHRCENENTSHFLSLPDPKSFGETFTQAQGFTTSARRVHPRQLYQVWEQTAPKRHRSVCHALRCDIENCAHAARIAPTPRFGPVSGIVASTQQRPPPHVNRHRLRPAARHVQRPGRYQPLITSHRRPPRLCRPRRWDPVNPAPPHVGERQVNMPLKQQQASHYFPTVSRRNRITTRSVRNRRERSVKRK